MNDVSRAIKAKQAVLEKLQADIEALRSAANIIREKKPTTGKPTRGRRKMSAAARKDLSKKLKAYWAKKRKTRK